MFGYTVKNLKKSGFSISLLILVKNSILSVLGGREVPALLSFPYQVISLDYEVYIEY